MIAQAYWDRLSRPGNVAQFIGVRFVRLWPLYMVGLLLARLEFLTHGHELQRPSGLFVALPLAILMLPASIGLNGPRWSLSYEMAVNIFYATLAPVLRNWMLVCTCPISGVLFYFAVVSEHSADIGYNSASGVWRVLYSLWRNVGQTRSEEADVRAALRARSNDVDLILILPYGPAAPTPAAPEAGHMAAPDYAAPPAIDPVSPCEASPHDRGALRRAAVRPVGLSRVCGPSFSSLGEVLEGLEGAHAVRRQAVGLPDSLDAAHFDPHQPAIARDVQCVVSPGASLKVSSTTRATVSDGSDALPGLRVEQRSRPSTPSAVYRACRRHTAGLDGPDLAMISIVPSPSPVAKMTRARATCFCVRLRSETMASRRLPSSGVTVTTMPALMQRA